jgi:16S rRNA (guanine527-N7)-methyltransferase
MQKNQKPAVLMPPEQWQRQLIDSAAQVGVSLSLAQADRMRCHAELLVQWNRSVNLTAITAPDDILVKHMVDSITAAPFIPEHSRLLDIGSGGGFPGLPLAIACPTIEATLIDASRKKTSFIRFACHALALVRVQTLHMRAEQLARYKEHRAGYQVVVCRALSSLERFAELAMPLLDEKGKLIAYRGQAGEGSGKEEKALPSEEMEERGMRCRVVPLRLPFSGAHRHLVIMERA